MCKLLYFSLLPGALRGNFVYRWLGAASSAGPFWVSRVESQWMLFSVSMSVSCLHFPRKHLLVEGEADFKGAPRIFLANLPIGVRADRLHMPIAPLSRSTWPVCTETAWVWNNPALSSKRQGGDY